MRTHRSTSAFLHVKHHRTLNNAQSTVANAHTRASRPINDGCQVRKQVPRGSSFTAGRGQLIASADPLLNRVKAVKHIPRSQSHLLCSLLTQDTAAHVRSDASLPYSFKSILHHFQQLAAYLLQTQYPIRPQPSPHIPIANKFNTVLLRRLLLSRPEKFLPKAPTPPSTAKKKNSGTHCSQLEGRKRA